MIVAKIARLCGFGREALPNSARAPEPKTSLDQETLRDPYHFISPLLGQDFSDPQKRFAILIQSLDPQEILTISSINHAPLDILGKKALVLLAHLDSTQSRAETQRGVTESDAHYQDRVELCTLERLWKNARALLLDPDIQAAIRNGMHFCMGLGAEKQDYVLYFEKHSEALLLEVVYANELSWKAA